MAVRYNRVTKTLVVNTMRVKGPFDSADFCFYGNVRKDMLRGVVRALIMAGEPLTNVTGNEHHLRQAIESDNFAIADHNATQSVYEMPAQEFVNHANKIK